MKPQGFVKENIPPNSQPPVAEQPNLEVNSLREVQEDITLIQPSPPKSSHLLGIVLIGLILSVGGVAGWHWWQYQRNHIITDNAQVQGHLSPVASRVTGTVSKVFVHNGDYVKVGQPLVVLETQDFNLSVQAAQSNLEAAQARLEGAKNTVVLTQNTNRSKIEEAQANLAAKQAAVYSRQTEIQQAQSQVIALSSQIHESQANVEMNKAKVNQSQTQLDKLKADFLRYESLYKEGVVSAQQRDAANAALNDALAALKASQEAVKQAEAEMVKNQSLWQQAKTQVNQARRQLQQAEAEALVANQQVQEALVGGEQVKIQKAQVQSEMAQVREAEANLALSKQQLNYTVIKAPVSGTIGQLTAQVGQVVQPQQPLLSVVPLDADALYVEANFKETALSGLRVGETATITADAYPNQSFLGVVAGISPATGSQFALIPPDNATGNFNKVVQWVSVRLTFKRGTDPDHKLRAGLSVTVAVDKDKAKSN